MPKWFNKCEESFTMEQTRRIDRLFYLMSGLESKLNTIVKFPTDTMTVVPSSGFYPEYRPLYENIIEKYNNLLVKREFDRKIIDDLKYCKERDGQYIRQLNEEITRLRYPNNLPVINIDWKNLYDNAISGNVKLKNENKRLMDHSDTLLRENKIMREKLKCDNDKSNREWTEW